MARVQKVSDDDTEATPMQKLRAASWNRQLQQSQASAPIDPEVAPHRLRLRADAYFDEAELPTFTGLALALGFDSVSAWEEAMERYSQAIAAHKAGIDEVARYAIWAKARSRVQLHYEEGIQSGVIQAQVGKFVLEVLGFTPKAPSEQKAPGAKMAAEAARSGYAEALKDVRKMGKHAADIAADAIRPSH